MPRRWTEDHGHQQLHRRHHVRLGPGGPDAIRVPQDREREGENAHQREGQPEHQRREVPEHEAQHRPRPVTDTEVGGLGPGRSVSRRWKSEDLPGERRGALGLLGTQERQPA